MLEIFRPPPGPSRPPTRNQITYLSLTALRATPEHEKRSRVTATGYREE